MIIFLVEGLKLQVQGKNLKPATYNF